ncbi:MAG: ribose-phosphate diphosphokinase [Desulfobacterales bacterium]|nr:ribose-phosphate diphosphokinase [Desulfobacterales bacterium]
MEYILNLDKDFEPVELMRSRTLDFESFKFSGGELQFKLQNREDLYKSIQKVTITNRFKDMDSLMQVLIAKDALEIKGVKRFDLVMPYIPYARQDRICADGESFTLKVYTNILNSANFERVSVLDAHSDVSVSLIKNCLNFSNMPYIVQTLEDIQSKDIVLVSPDSGADKKSDRLFENLKAFKDIIKCDKKRDPNTGKLTGFQVFTDDLKGRDCLIVDDICDAGGTFLGIGEELKKKNAGNVYLFVTHGIFSKGYDVLNKMFTKIYTTNSFRDIVEKATNIKQFKINL